MENFKYGLTNGKTVRPEVYGTWQEAACELMRIVWSDDPIGWRIEEAAEEPKDVPELIPDYEAAQKYLGPSDDGEGKQFYECSIPRRNYIQVSAFNELLTLCKAWNRADGFVPNWMGNNNQAKWFPRIEQSFNGIIVTTDWRYSVLLPFVFKTQGRAQQFGEKFIYLFRQLYGIKEGE